MGLSIYKASAGSGKTFTLVHLYLSKVIKYPSSFRSILAITFTNKATEEMKSRIIRELDLLASGKPARHLELLVKQLGLNEPEVRENAKVVLRKILHDYSSFAVTTIDSYFQTLSKTLAREIHLPAKFDIELNMDTVSERVTDRLLQRVGAEPSLTGWLRDYVEERIDYNDNWNILKDLKSMSKLLIGSGKAYDTSLHHKPESLRKIRDTIFAIRNQYEKTLRDYGTQATELIDQCGYMPDDFSYKIGGVVGFFYKIAAPNPKPDAYFIKEGGRVDKGIQNIDTWLSKDKQNETQLKALIEEHLHPMLVEAASYAREHYRSYMTARSLSAMLYTAGITGIMAEETAAIKEDESFMFLSDTTRLLAEVVKDDDASFIFEKSGTTFRHVFIDEFQDTGTDQWNILRPLVMNSLATGNDALIVGDAKQSIYRWRGGNMELLLSGVKKDLAAFKDIIEEKSLLQNYRSLEQVVTFNNRFFEAALPVFKDQLKFGNDNLSIAYEPSSMIQQTDPKKAGLGYVEAILWDKPEKADKKGNSDEEDPTDATWKERSLAYLLEQVPLLLEKGYALRDLAVLVRKGSEEQEIADYLLNNSNYPFLSSNSLLVANNDKVKLMLNCLQYLTGNDESLLLQEIMHVHNGAGQPPTSDIPYRDTRKTAENDEFLSKLKASRKILLSLPVDLTCARIRQLASFDQPDPYLDLYADIVAAYSGRYGTGIESFLLWWDKESEARAWSIEVPEQTDAIRILSIHRSKGLEFPVVFMPFIDWDIAPSRNGLLWVNGQTEPFSNFGTLPVVPSSRLEGTDFEMAYFEEYDEGIIDNLNLLYVAFTRAGRELRLMLTAGGKKNRIAAHVESILAQLAGDQEPEVIKLGIRLSFGTRTTAEPASEEAPDGIYRPEIRKPASITNLIDVEPAWPELTVRADSEEITFGKRIHAVLAGMRKKEDLDSTLNKLSVTEQWNLSKAELAVLRNDIDKIWDFLSKNGWTDERYTVWAETDFCDELGNLHRPDRVLVQDKTAIVLDFKTGSKSKTHPEQVAGYMQVLRATGMESVSGFLIYTDTLTIEEVKPGAQLRIL